MFGRVSAAGPSGAFDERHLPGTQGALLLAYLVIERRQVPRDGIASVLWGDEPPSGWASGLNALVSKTRRRLDQAGIGRDTLISSAGTLEIALPPSSWVDLESAVRRLDRAVGSWRQGDLSAALPDATAASAVLRRPFLAGVDNPWVDAVRRDAAARLYTAYEILSEGWTSRGDHHLGATVAESAIRLDPLRESGYRLAMSAHLAGGNRAMAIRTLDDCTQVLRAELGVEPSPETVAVVQDVGPVG